jgi:hypothetical protein
MGLVESHMGQEDPPLADPYTEFHDVLNSKKMDDAGLNDRLELQEQAKVHRQMKELITSHVEYLQQSVKAEASYGMWGPQEKGSNE